MASGERGQQPTTDSLRETHDVSTTTIGLISGKRVKVNGRVQTFRCGGDGHVGHGKTFSDGGWASHIRNCPVAYDWQAERTTLDFPRPTTGSGRVALTDEERIQRAAERANAYASPAAERASFLRR